MKEIHIWYKKIDLPYSSLYLLYLLNLKTLCFFFVLQACLDYSKFFNKHYDVQCSWQIYMGTLPTNQWGIILSSTDLNIIYWIIKCLFLEQCSDQPWLAFLFYNLHEDYETYLFFSLNIGNLKAWVCLSQSRSPQWYEATGL